MNCPNDRHEMHRVSVKSHYGQPVLLDQCPECGGLWFDGAELWSVRQGEAEKIDEIHTVTLQNHSLFEDRSLRCPKDSAKLTHFNDPYFPKDIVIARCPDCGGFWMNRGEFTRYQEYRESLKNPKKTIEANKHLEQQITRVIEAYKTDDTTDTLGRLGRFLGTPLDETNLQPLEPDKLSKNERNLIATIVDTLLVILRSFVWL